MDSRTVERLLAQLRECAAQTGPDSPSGDVAGALKYASQIARWMGSTLLTVDLDDLRDTVSALSRTLDELAPPDRSASLLYGACFVAKELGDAYKTALASRESFTDEERLMQDAVNRELLWGMVNEPRSLAGLIDESGDPPLPNRLVHEALEQLIHIGAVESIGTGQSVRFAATERGKTWLHRVGGHPRDDRPADSSRLKNLLDRFRDFLGSNSEKFKLSRVDLELMVRHEPGYGEDILNKFSPANKGEDRARDPDCWIHKDDFRRMLKQQEKQNGPFTAAFRESNKEGDPKRPRQPTLAAGKVG